MEVKCYCQCHVLNNFGWNQRTIECEHCRKANMEEKQNELPTPSGSNLPQELRDEIEKICVEHVDCDIFEVVYLIENLMADQISQAKSQGIEEGKKLERERMINTFLDNWDKFIFVVEWDGMKILSDDLEDIEWMGGYSTKDILEEELIDRHPGMYRITFLCSFFSGQMGDEGRWEISPGFETEKTKIEFIDSLDSSQTEGKV